MLKTGAILLILCLTLNGARSQMTPAGLGATGVERFNGYDVCTDLLFRDLVQGNSYPFESYQVKTEDGFILRLFRMQEKYKNIVGGKKVVLLQHGVFDSADDFVVNGEQHSLAFVLANKGYDVWLSNSRGNKYSRAHATLSPSNKQFWDFSFQEMAQYDIKANIEFIRQKTGVAKVTYIGHSQGTTQMFAALGSKEVSGYVNSVVNKYIALAPVVLLRAIGNPVVNRIATDTILSKAIQTLGITEMFPGTCSKSSPTKWLTSAFCTMASFFCNLFMGLTDNRPSYNNDAITKTIGYYYPAGSSTRSLVHFQQLMLLKDEGNRKFMKYNYGTNMNIQKYGTPNPPEYDLGKIKIPVALFVGNEDNLATVPDVNVLIQQLQAKKVNVKAYFYPYCGHATFVWAKDSTKIFNDVLAELSSI